MTKVYDDKNSKITKGKFPKPTVTITKKYYCPTAWEKKDSTDTEDTLVDNKTVKKTEKCKDCP